MGRRKKRAASVVLDSFLDIMTCILGVMMLIILMTGVDAAQIKVLIPTPLQHPTSMKPIFVECRNEELFLVPVAELREVAREELRRITQAASGDQMKLLQLLSEARAETDAYSVDLIYAPVGQFAIVPKPDVRGYRLENMAAERATDWFGRILTGMNPEEEMLSFLVRDDSYNVFKRARGLAWAQKVEVSYELMDVEDPIKFGLGGSRPMAQ